VKILRHILARPRFPYLALGLILLLPGCVSERHFARDSWPFGNPNAPLATSETAQRALGREAAITPIGPQAGNVWPGPVQPVPTLSSIQQNSNAPLGQGYTPSLPSPYPPGVNPNQQLNFDPVPSLPPLSAPPPVVNDGSVYATQPPGIGQGVVPPVPGDAR
jgi:hypothetical protein